MFLCAREFGEYYKPVTELSQYEEVKTLWPEELVSHFPSSATGDTGFFFQRGFLQGIHSLQLKEVLSVSDIEILLQRYSEKALAVFRWGRWDDSPNGTKHVPIPYYFTSEDGSLAFPEDFVIMVLLAEEHNGGNPWNHGRTSGIALSVERKTAVYWAEDW